MVSGFVGNEIRRAFRNQARVNVFVILFAILVPACALPFLYERVSGPYPSTIQQISALARPGLAPHTYVHVEFDVSLEDQYNYHISGGSDHKNDWYHFLRQPDGRFLIIKTHSESLQSVIEGTLSDLDDDVTEKVLPAIRGTVKGSALRVMLDDESHSEPIWGMLTICMLAIGICIWQLAKDWRNRENPAKNRALRQIAKVGPTDEIALAIDAEMSEGSAKLGNLLVTRSWIIRPTRFGTDFLYMGDIAWAYLHMAGDKSDGLAISEGSAAIIQDTHGSRTIFPLAREQAERLLEDIGRRVPWASIGFTPELMQEWRQDQKALIEAVEQRKAEMLKGPAGV